MDPAASRPAVVMDNGTGYTKVGFTGNVEPCFIVPTVVAVKDSFVNQPGGSSMKGSNWLTKHSAGIDNWDAMERFWQQCIFDYLRCDPDDHYFLLTESSLTTPESRECTGEIMFETLNVPALYIAVQPVLALAAGYTTSKCEMTGVMVGIGDGATHVVPVADGYVIGGSIK